MNTTLTHKISFEGEFSEETISQLLQKIDQWPAGIFSNRANIKYAVIELCSNVISHHSGTDFGSVSITPQNGICEVEINSYASSNDFEIVQSILNELKTVPNLKEHYFNKLEKAGQNESVQLGMLKTYRCCNGNMVLEGKVVASKILLTIKLKINDSN